YLITGFPWNLLGYAVQASGVRQIAAVTGVYGLSFLAVATSALLAWALGGGRAKLETRNSKLETGNWKLETGNSKIEDRKSKLETRNSELVTRNSGPESRHSKLGTRNSEFEIRPLTAGPLEGPPSGFRYWTIFPRPSAVLALVAWLALLLVAQWRLAPPPAVVGKESAILVQPNVPL